MAATFCESGGVEVRDAGHTGKGVFATRACREGEVVMRFAGRVVHRDELAALTPWESEHLGELTRETYQVLPAPRCYLNHGCEPNVVSTHDTVYALRTIAPGEELTIDYRLNAHDDGGVWKMECRCAAFDGPHVVVGDFFSLPEETQARYLRWAPAFIRDEHARRRSAAPESAPGGDVSRVATTDGIPGGAPAGASRT